MQNTQFNMRCSQKTLDKIEKLAVEFEISNSGLVRMLINNAYEDFFNKSNV